MAQRLRPKATQQRFRLRRRLRRKRRGRRLTAKHKPGSRRPNRNRGRSSMAHRKVADCENMDQVRAEIDRIDDALLDLVAERFSYVDRAWQLKKDPAEATVPWRIRQVIDKVEARAKERGLPPELAVALWRQ